MAKLYYGYSGIESFGNADLDFSGLGQGPPQLPPPAPTWLLAAVFIAGMVWYVSGKSDFSGYERAPRRLPRRKRRR